MSRVTPLSNQAPANRPERSAAAGWIGRRLQLALAASLGVTLLAFAIGTRHWPLVGDAPLLHYAVFLMEHGMAPYRQIIDPNMPGTYAVEWAVMHTLGMGGAAWRIFDYSLMALAILFSMAIAGRQAWFAGFFAGGVLTLIHGRDGLLNTGQRDLVMTVFELAACWALFSRVRHEGGRTRDFLWSALFGLCLGAAATIKPIALLLAPLLLVFSGVALRRRGRAATAHITAAIIGIIVPGLLCLAFLLHEQALPAFLHIVFQLIPYHAKLWRRTPGWLLSQAISSVLLPLVIAWLPLAAAQKRWRNWEGACLYAGAAVGLLSFYVQRKGFDYHRYPSEAFLLLLIGLDCTAMLQMPSRRVLQGLAALALAWGVFAIGIGSAAESVRFDWRNQEFFSMLQGDLTQMGGSSLSGQVQCFDMARGCADVLLRMQLVQSTGILYDCYLFSPLDAPEREWERRMFWRQFQANPARVLIFTSTECDAGSDYQYRILTRWPQFSAYLARHYSLQADRVPPHAVRWSRRAGPPTGYRIYVRKAATIEPSDRIPAQK